MGVSYLVVPVNLEVRTYLQELGQAGAGSVIDGRDPTPTEIRAVVRQLRGIDTFEGNGKRGELLQVQLEAAASPSGPYTLLNVHDAKGEDSPVGISFKGWPELVVLVVANLAAMCGPLVIFPDTEGDPLVLTGDEDISTLLESWEHTEGYANSDSAVQMAPIIDANDNARRSPWRRIHCKSAGRVQWWPGIY